MPDLVGLINFGPTLLRARVTPACQGFRKQEDAAGAIADILIVLTPGSATLHQDGLPCYAKQLIRLLIQTEHRTFRGIGLLVQVHNILHAGDKGGVLFGWDHPALVQTWLQFAYLGAGIPTRARCFR